MRRHSKQLRSRKRFGSAAVECAFCIPVVFLITIGTLEVTSGLFLKEALTVTAYEGCRVGIRRRATRQAIIDTCNDLLDDRGITGASVDVTPASFFVDADNTIPIPALTNITVTITAPTDGNTNYFLGFMSERDMTVSVSMVREFDE